MKKGEEILARNTSSARAHRNSIRALLFLLRGTVSDEQKTMNDLIIPRQVHPQNQLK